jgi:rhodanese-related sulfurtransferase
MVREITAAELAARRGAGEEPLVLDVREAWELQIARLPGVRHIPMNEIPARLAELDPQVEVIVLCRSGGRSMQVAQFLERRGFRDPVNLAGGILAWSRDVDPAVCVY